MTRKQFLSAAMLVASIGGASGFREETTLTEPAGPRSAKLPVEGQLASFEGATTWINSPPLTPAGLRGKVVLVDFWTLTCVNWLRTLPYVRAWAAKYKDKGLVVIGVHTPEFTVEHDVANVRRAAQAMRVDYPVAVDNDYGVWHAFDNNYWPAVYLADAQGRIRFHHFGEEAYEETERAIQQLLTEAGAAEVPTDLVTVNPQGTEVAAGWNDLKSGESYVGSQKRVNFASPGGAEGKPHAYTVPERLALNHWGLGGEWTVGREIASADKPNARIVYRFHARDVNLVMGPGKAAGPVKFRVLIDGHAPEAAHGTDTDAQGAGTVTEPKLYQLIRQPRPIVDRTFEIEFLDPGVETFCFTFG
ncbi:MAG TPA: redoxin domain-containing protein [Thermoanaerobaculia bacterium]